MWDYYLLWPGSTFIAPCAPGSPQGSSERLLCLPYSFWPLFWSLWLYCILSCLPAGGLGDTRLVALTHIVFQIASVQMEHSAQAKRALSSKQNWSASEYCKTRIQLFIPCDSVYVSGYDVSICTTLDVSFYLWAFRTWLLDRLQTRIRMVTRESRLVLGNIVAFKKT